MFPSPTPAGSSNISTSLEQALREALMDAKLMKEWQGHGSAWARMDMHGIELSKQPPEVYEERYVVGGMIWEV